MRAPLFTLDADLQLADLQMQEATLKNAQAGLSTARSRCCKTSAGTQKGAWRTPEAALRTAQARLNSVADAARAPQGRSARSRAPSSRSISASARWCRPARPCVALLPPGNLKVRFFVSEAMLPKIRIDDTVNVHCDGCPSGLTAKVSFIARTSEFTPPVIYSLEERNKLVFLIEARPEQPERLRVGQPVSVTLAPRTRSSRRSRRSKGRPK